MSELGSGMGSPGLVDFCGGTTGSEGSFGGNSTSLTVIQLSSPELSVGSSSMDSTCYTACYTEYPENTENPEYLYGKLRKTQNTPTENTDNYGKLGKPRILIRKTTENMENYGKHGKLRKTQNTPI